MRWLIIRLLNRLEDTCRADLAMWAIGPKPFDEILEMRGTAGQCERRGELSYCGKCRRE